MKTGLEEMSKGNDDVKAKSEEEYQEMGKWKQRLELLEENQVIWCY